MLQLRTFEFVWEAKGSFAIGTIGHRSDVFLHVQISSWPNIHQWTWQVYHQSDSGFRHKSPIYGTAKSYNLYLWKVREDLHWPRLKQAADMKILGGCSTSMYHLLTGGILRIWITRTQTGHMCCSPLCKVTIISATLETTTQLFIKWGQGGISLKCKMFIKTSTIPSLLMVSPSNCSPGSIILQFLNHHLPAAPHLLLYQAPPNLRLQCILEASGDAFEVYKPFHLGARPKHGEWEHLGKCQDFLLKEKDNLLLEHPEDFAISLPPCVSWECPARRQAGKHWHSPFLPANQPWECFVHPYNVSKGTDANFSRPKTSETLWNMHQNKVNQPIHKEGEICQKWGWKSLTLSHSTWRWPSSLWTAQRSPHAAQSRLVIGDTGRRGDQNSWDFFSHHAKLTPRAEGWGFVLHSFQACDSRSANRI